ncbi:MAG: MarR family transcriptional regulator [Chloroflexota bacterium]
MPTDGRPRQQVVEFDATKHICFNLGKVVRRVYNLYHQPLAKYGLTPSQLFVFSALWMEDGINFSDLASRVSIDVSTLTGIIDRMEREGFVERKPDPRDRRSIRLFLTQNAKETGPAILMLADDLDAVLRRPFSQEEMETFERVLRALAEKED